MELQIKKVKINAKGIATVWYVQSQDNGKKPKLTHEGDAVVHDDFRNAVDELAPHYALLTGYASFARGLKIETLKTATSNFHVSGYSIGGKDEDEGIVITGHIIVNFSGKAVIVNSPFTRFNEGEETRYKFMDQLIECVQQIINEAREYINGKFKPEAQQQIQFPALEGGTIQLNNGNSETFVSEGGEMQTS